MKSIGYCILLLILWPAQLRKEPRIPAPANRPTLARNLFIITTDGFRWQELFSGADSLLIDDEEFTPDGKTVKELYWDVSAEKRRKKLMPFFWNVIATNGQLYGNRFFDNKVNTANLYSRSYPGYNELFTGTTDPSIASNQKQANPNINVLEWLNALPSFKGEVAAFSSWDVFPYILNSSRNQLPVNSGYNPIPEISSPGEQLIDKVQSEAVYNKTATRYDQLTFLTAREYILQKKPRVVCIGFGETDEFAHQERYDLYLEQAKKVDQMIGELWHLLQTTPGYKNNTILVITTDHGRGSRTHKWMSHGEWIRGSSETWLALMGPGIEPRGEIKVEEQLYAQQLAATIATFLGEEFKPGENVAPGISLR